MIFKISNSDGRLRIAEIAALTDALGEAASQAYGRRTRRTVRFADGGEALEERRAYDRYGRLVEIAAFGTSVKWRYDARGRVARQVVDGSPIDFAYTKDGRLAGKWLGGRESPDASVEYEYAKDGRIAARTANGVRQAFAYDARGQLVAVRENGADVERYAYDRAGNMVRKTIRGKTTTFTFDGANQLVSSTCDGVTTRYAYDAAGRLVREGNRTYRYGYLDKVLSVTDGKRSYRYAYHVDGQLARADYGEDGRAGVGEGGRAGSPLPAGSEAFLWDGLALVRRGDESFVNEPHVGGGNPVVSSKGTACFNDVLGTTVGVREGRGAARKGAKRRYTAAALTAFGEPVPVAATSHNSNIRQFDHSIISSPFFTGKPQVEGLGRVFLCRNYRADLAKWQTADPLGYPDGWNQLAYCKNGANYCGDFVGGVLYYYFQAGLYYYSLNEVFAPGLPVSEINSFQDALNHYQSGAGGTVSAGSGLRSEMIGSDGFITGEAQILNGIAEKLRSVPCPQLYGYVSNSPGAFRGYRSLTHGSYRVDIEYDAYWTADSWIHESDGRLSRIVRSSFSIRYHGSNDWDFEWNPNYSFWENVSQELIPGAIAGSIGNPRAYTIRYDFNRKYQLAVKQFIYTE